MLVLNDIHVDKNYAPRTNAVCETYGGCCTSISEPTKDEKNYAGFWGSNQGDSICDIPRYFFIETLKQLKQMKEQGKFDFIISLGDMADHGTFRDTGHNIVQENLFIYDNLRKYFPDSLILPALGNHETEPIEFYEFGTRNFTTDYILPLYKTFISQEKIDDFINKGFYEYELEEYNLKVISWNT